MDDQKHGAGGAEGMRINRRVAGMLAGLVVLISASVIVTDYFSPRARPSPPAATATSPTGDSP